MDAAHIQWLQFDQFVLPSVQLCVFLLLCIICRHGCCALRCPLLCIISCTFGEIMYHSTRLVIFTFDYTVLTLSYFPYFCLRLLSSNYVGLCFFHSHNSFDFKFLSGWQISQVWSFFVFQQRMFFSITARMLSQTQFRASAATHDSFNHQ